MPDTDREITESTDSSTTEKPIDLRSDAVTRPDQAMWDAMLADPLDWSHGEDRTVKTLESTVALLLRKGAALFVPTGTMANTLALLGWCRPGDTFVVDADAHVLRSEADAYADIARLGVVSLTGVSGLLTPAQITEVLASETTVRPRLLWLENTHTHAGGSAAPIGDLATVSELAKASGLRVHLDGARLWNAAIATGQSPAESAAPADSVTVNLNKGLGCPAGALLCGPSDFIRRSRSHMRGLGGRISQAGLLAACGLSALSRAVTFPSHDHELATYLAMRLRLVGLSVQEPDSNIVFVEVSDASETTDRLAESDVFVLARDPTTIRLVTHRDIEREDIDKAVAVIAQAVLTID